jgi:putative FmdB family regulatory protein
MIYLYKCNQCAHEQEIEHKLNEQNLLPCQQCEAPPEEMKRLINAHIVPHVSWSTWKVGE